MRLTFRASYKEILFAGVGAYTLQHGAFSISRILLYYFESSTNLVAEWVLFHILLYLVIYFLGYIVLIRPARKQGELYTKDSRLIILALFYLFVAVILSGAIQYGDTFTTQVVCRLYDLICSLAILFLMFGISRSGQLQYEKVILEQLLLKDEAQRQISEEYAQLIDFKVHDLRHQIQALKEIDNKELREETVAELEAAVNAYSSIEKTGNSALDTLLNEKRRTCEKNGIHLDCVVDGHLLSFMSMTDVYSFFCNAINNAIESVSAEPDEQERFISVRVKQRQGHVYIRIENGFSGVLVLNDGLPVTTKADKTLHGFGVKSMRSIIQKYGGEMLVSQKDGLFTVEAIMKSRAAQ